MSEPRRAAVLCKAMMIGALGRNPEMRYTPNRQAVAILWVVVDDEQDALRVVIFGKLAERAADTLRKGRRVYVEGRLQTRQDGTRWPTVEVVADTVLPLDPTEDDLVDLPF